MRIFDWIRSKVSKPKKCPCGNCREDQASFHVDGQPFCSVEAYKEYRQ